MPQNLKSKAVSKDIINALNKLMNYNELSSFRLVGGTSLSLQFGHRQSIDIDLFTDAEYGTVNFQAIDDFLRNNYKYTDLGNYSEVSPGRMYF